MSKMYRIEFDVVPESGIFGGAFPLDMLRYDSCYPSSSVDVNRMIADREIADGRAVNSSITLVHREHGGKKWRPTEGRWRSFGWRVTDVRASEY